MGESKSDISKVRQGIVQLKYRADGFKFQPNKYNQMAQNISFGFKFLTNAERLKVTNVGKVRHGMISRKYIFNQPICTRSSQSPSLGGFWGPKPRYKFIF